MEVLDQVVNEQAVAGIKQLIDSNGFSPEVAQMIYGDGQNVAGRMEAFQREVSKHAADHYRDTQAAKREHFLSQADQALQNKDFKTAIQAKRLAFA